MHSPRIHGWCLLNLTFILLFFFFLLFDSVNGNFTNCCYCYNCRLQSVLLHTWFLFCFLLFFFSFYFIILYPLDEKNPLENSFTFVEICFYEIFFFFVVVFQSIHSLPFMDAFFLFVLFFLSLLLCNLSEYDLCLTFESFASFTFLLYFALLLTSTTEQHPHLIHILFHID